MEELEFIKQREVLILIILIIGVLATSLIYAISVIFGVKVLIEEFRKPRKIYKVDGEDIIRILNSYTKERIDRMGMRNLIKEQVDILNEKIVVESDKLNNNQE